MAKSFSHKILNSSRGQSAVEYIMLLAVISSLTYVVLNNKQFKDFMKGDAGLFATMKRGMTYSYRYGRDLTTAKDYDQAVGFEYTTTAHDQYVDQSKNESHFFMGLGEYAAQ